MNVEIVGRVVVIGQFFSLVDHGLRRLLLDIVRLVGSVVVAVTDAALLASDDGEREGRQEGHGLPRSQGVADVGYETMLRHTVLGTRLVISMTKPARMTRVKDIHCD